MKTPSLPKSVSVLLGLSALFSHSVAQSLPVVNLGATSFMDGAPPAGPGFYLTGYTQYREATHFKDGAGNDLPLPDPKLRAYSFIAQGIYLSNYEIPGLHAKPGFDFLLPAVSIDLDFGAKGPFPRAQSGFGDITFGPALQFNPIMTEKGPLFVHRLEAQIIAPTGVYSRDREINPGSGHFSINPYWSGTLFLGPRVAASFRAHYLWNEENDRPILSLGPNVTSTQAGQAAHVNFTLDAGILPNLRAGLNGYWLRQFTSSKINDHSIHYFEETLGLGPGLLFSFGPNSHLFANLYFELETKNRPEGLLASLRYVHKF